MRPGDVLTAIARALQQSQQFTGGAYINHLADWENGDAGLSQPIVELQPVGKVRADAFDSDLVGYTTDGQGDRTGRIFQVDWEMQIQVDIYVASGNFNLDATALGYDLETVLLEYDSKQQDKAFPDDDGGTIDDITHFRVGEGRREDDLGGEVAARRWRQDLEARFRDQAETSDPTITTVEVPQTSEMTVDANEDAEIVWDYLP